MGNCWKQVRSHRCGRRYDVREYVQKDNSGLACLREARKPVYLYQENDFEGAIQTRSCKISGPGKDWEGLSAEKRSTRSPLAV